ncbi:ABC transporter ATP-binding protein [Nocardioides sp. C4-1]|uniref:ABC transporter ATP-binding protein n=1 Tax=Nocardioides sp. C4-1 TaxID=3151851 RepID=UPI003267EAE8
MIAAREVSFAYGRTRVLDAAGLAAEHGRVLGLIGPNGSGKSTLLQLLHGALRSPDGDVRLDGEPIASFKARDVAQRIAVVVQESGGETSLTVGEMVLLGRVPHLSTFQRTGAADRVAAARALRRVGAAHLAERPFAGLSGGERQRCLIARALAQEATHLLLDEPTNHLDIRYQHDVLSLVRSLATGTGTCVVVVLHDLNLAARYCDDVVLLDRGTVAASGTVEEVLRPDVLEPVYEIGVERLETDSGLHLLFHQLVRPPATLEEQIA